VSEGRLTHLRRRASAAWLVLATLLGTGCDSPTGLVDPAELIVTAPSRYLEPGQTLLMSATAHDASGRPLEGVRLRWTSRSPEVAEVRDGLVTGRAIGTATIVASAGAVADSIQVTVEPPAVAELVVWPDTLYLIQGRTGRLFTEMRDRAGRPMKQALHWANSAPGVAVMEGSEVRAVSVGQTTLVATAGMKSVKVPVHVVTGARYVVGHVGAHSEAYSRAYGVNNRGEVVGTRGFPGLQRPFLWSRGRMTDLGTVEGFGSSRALAISDSGHVVGSAENPAFDGYQPTVRRVPWVRKSNGVLRPVEVGLAVAEATHVNERGQAVISGAVTYSADGRTVGGAWLWENGFVTPLFAPGTEAGSRGYTLAGGISAGGHVGVSAFREAAPSRADPDAYLWKDGGFTAAGAMHVHDVNDLGHAAGSCVSRNLAGAVGCTWNGNVRADWFPAKVLVSINVYGDAVGWAQIDSEAGGSRAVLLRGGQLVDLNDLVPASDWEISEAHSINDLGWIAATARHRGTGVLGGLLLKPAS